MAMKYFTTDVELEDGSYRVTGMIVDRKVRIRNAYDKSGFQLKVTDPRILDNIISYLEADLEAGEQAAYEAEYDL